MLAHVLLALVAGVSANPIDTAKRATPTVYLAGDSTMAKTPAPHDGTPKKKQPLSPPPN